MIAFKSLVGAAMPPHYSNHHNPATATTTTQQQQPHQPQRLKLTYDMASSMQIFCASPENILFEKSSMQPLTATHLKELRNESKKNFEANLRSLLSCKTDGGAYVPDDDPTCSTMLFEAEAFYDIEKVQFGSQSINVEDLADEAFRSIGKSGMAKIDAPLISVSYLHMGNHRGLAWKYKEDKADALDFYEGFETRRRMIAMAQDGGWETNLQHSDLDFLATLSLHHYKAGRFCAHTLHAFRKVRLLGVNVTARGSVVVAMTSCYCHPRFVLSAEHYNDERKFEFSSQPLRDPETIVSRTRHHVAIAALLTGEILVLDSSFSQLAPHLVGSLDPEVLVLRSPLTLTKFQVALLISKRSNLDIEYSRARSAVCIQRHLRGFLGRRVLPEEDSIYILANMNNSAYNGQLVQVRRLGINGKCRVSPLCGSDFKVSQKKLHRCPFPTSSWELEYAREQILCNRASLTNPPTDKFLRMYLDVWGEMAQLNSDMGFISVPGFPLRDISDRKLLAFAIRESETEFLHNDMLSTMKKPYPVTLQKYFSNGLPLPSTCMPTAILKRMFPLLRGMYRNGLLLVWERPWVGVAPSDVSGRGVFAKRDIPKGTVVTTYPINTISIGDASSTLGNRVFFGDEQSYAISSSSGRAHPSSNYSMMVDNIAQLSVQGDPDRHTPSSCGHLLNDSRGTGQKSNTMILHMFGGMLIIVQVTEDLKAGEELLCTYAKNYWNNYDSEVEAITSLA